MSRPWLFRGLIAEGNRQINYSPHQWGHPATPGWEIPKDQDNGFIDVSGYQNPDIICHVGATPGRSSITVAAGDSIGLQWTSWPESHHGNMVNYLANCNGECEKADKTQLRFNKLSEEGLKHPNPNIPVGKQIDGTTTGFWAGDQLIADGDLTWFQVPEWLAAGNYVLRHELMALHNAMPQGSGIQHIPQCINLIVTGGGSDSLDSGTLGTDLYRADQPGVVVNIFANPGEYTVPGPELYKRGETNSSPEKPAASAKSGAPAKASESSEQKTSAAPKGAYVMAPEKTPSPAVTSSRPAYHNSTFTSARPDQTPSVGGAQSSKIPGFSSTCSLLVSAL